MTPFGSSRAPIPTIEIVEQMKKSKHVIYIKHESTQTKDTRERSSPTEEEKEGVDTAAYELALRRYEGL
jgi:hypothetical protein